MSELFLHRNSDPERPIADEQALRPVDPAPEDEPGSAPERELEPESQPESESESQPEPAAPSEAPAPFVAETGARVGDWILESRLGVGGFGEVWQARRPLGRRDGLEQVAVKIARDPPRIAALAHEAQILARLEHDAIVRIHAIHADASPPHIVMDLLRGGDLRTRLANANAALAWPDAARIGSDVARALQVAHEAGVVHGDIKPANVLLTEDDRPVLADFGLGEVEREPTIEGEPSLALSLELSHEIEASLRGTLAYMAPEVRRGRPVTPAADVYALGLLLHEMLVGELPRGAWRPVAQRVAVPEALDGLLRSALAPDPARRPEAWEVATTLDALGEGPGEGAIAGTDRRRTCPVDGGLLHPVTVHGATLDRCRGCGGTWFDRGELAEVTEQMIRAAAAEAGRRADLEGGHVAVRPTGRDSGAVCPIGREPLGDARLGVAGRLVGVAEVCGHGVWMNGETRRRLIAAAHAAGRNGTAAPAPRAEPARGPATEPAPRPEPEPQTLRLADAAPSRADHLRAAASSRRRWNVRPSAPTTPAWRENLKLLGDTIASGIGLLVLVFLVVGSWLDLFGPEPARTPAWWERPSTPAVRETPPDPAPTLAEDRAYLARLVRSEVHDGSVTESDRAEARRRVSDRLRRGPLALDTLRLLVHLDVLQESSVRPSDELDDALDRIIRPMTAADAANADGATGSSAIR